MKGFINFIREQKVVGLAVGFILGGSVSKVVSSLVADIINPVLSVGLGAADDLKNAVLQIGPVRILYGNFLSALIDFLVVALAVYIIVKAIGIDKKKA